MRYLAIWWPEKVVCFNFLKQTTFLGIEMLKITSFACIRFQTLWHRYLGPFDDSSRRYMTGWHLSLFPTRTISKINSEFGIKDGRSTAIQTARAVYWTWLERTWWERTPSSFIRAAAFVYSGFIFLQWPHPAIDVSRGHQLHVSQASVACQSHPAIYVGRGRQLHASQASVTCQSHPAIYVSQVSVTRQSGVSYMSVTPYNRCQSGVSYTLTVVTPYNMLVRRQYAAAALRFRHNFLPSAKRPLSPSQHPPPPSTPHLPSGHPPGQSTRGIKNTPCPPFSTAPVIDKRAVKKLTTPSPHPSPHHHPPPPPPAGDSHGA